jgi:hypothetical protein
LIKSAKAAIESVGIEYEKAAFTLGKSEIAPRMGGLQIGEEVTWCIRPDQVMVVREDRPLGKAVSSNIFSGKITEIISNGATYLLDIEGDFNLEIEMPSHAFERLGLEQEKIIRVS